MSHPLNEPTLEELIEMLHAVAWREVQLERGVDRAAKRAAGLGQYAMRGAQLGDGAKTSRVFRSADEEEEILEMADVSDLDSAAIVLAFPESDWAAQ